MFSNYHKWIAELITYIWVVLMSGMLEMDITSRWRPKVTVKMAFMLGSSKQGKTRLASVGSIWDMAMYLWNNSEMNMLNIIGKIIKCLLFILFDAVLFVSGPVQSFQVISEFADEIHRQSVIGFDGQLTNRGTSELTYQFALRINGSENS